MFGEPLATQRSKKAASSSLSLVAFLALCMTALCARAETWSALRRRAISYSSLTTRATEMTSFSSAKSLCANSRNVMLSEICLAMANTVALGYVVPRWARVGLTSGVSLTSSTSYLLRASSMLTGRPDQMTSSGLMGGMKRVDLSAWIS